MTNPIPPSQDLELALSPEEALRAQKPQDLTNLDSDSTHPLTEAPTAPGAVMESEPVLEPMLVARPIEEDTAPIQAPAFFQRLGLAGHPSRVKIQKEPLGYSLTADDNWPVFLLRKSYLGPIEAQELKKIAALAKKQGHDRVCLGPYNELDIFFNDRKSLERAAQELQIEPDPEPGPFRLLACPGLLFCPQAAKDTISAAQTLFRLGQTYAWPTWAAKEPLIISVAGCSAGQGQDCGLYEYSDLTIQGKRRAYPSIDQTIASFSPKLAKLVANCPGQALFRPSGEDLFLDIDQSRCRRCGWCVQEDPALAWPKGQGSYFRVTLSGRRLGSLPTYLPPKAIWEPAPDDFALVSQKIFQLVELWLKESRPQEILYDFLERTRSLNFFDR
ncbi:MAG: hypothetical protein LBT38_05295 [Deltaproteobacteria bacterium]|jgi:dissimilatory sulfite reductase (desulfoviridin) alpha/beta subunit|nr:hypothetical protein [Deltaproteobacteria bacterium]